jgi:8-oxo-dGTP pyrophosphatase MutT (NUDIX family)
VKAQGTPRHLATPRVLLFLQRGGEWLFIEGAPHKWWSGRLNGIGGSVEPHEDVLTAARRETEEETGLRPEALHLAAIIHTVSEPPVLLFVFLGTLPPGDLQPCDEGSFHWFTPQALQETDLPLMPDLPFLLPRLWGWQAGDPPLSFLFDFTSGFAAHEGQ